MSSGEESVKMQLPQELSPGTPWTQTLEENA